MECLRANKFLYCLFVWFTFTVHAKKLNFFFFYYLFSTQGDLNILMMCVFIFINMLECFCFFQRYACGVAKICPRELKRHNSSRIPRGDEVLLETLKEKGLINPSGRERTLPLKVCDSSIYDWYDYNTFTGMFEMFTYFLDLGDICDTERPRIFISSRDILIWPLVSDVYSVCSCHKPINTLVWFCMLLWMCLDRK
jgi:hypothetical protein